MDVRALSSHWPFPAARSVHGCVWRLTADCYHLLPFPVHHAGNPGRSRTIPSLFWLPGRYCRPDGKWFPGVGAVRLPCSHPLGEAVESSPLTYVDVCLIYLLYITLLVLHLRHHASSCSCSSSSSLQTPTPPLIPPPVPIPYHPTHPPPLPASANSCFIPSTPTPRHGPPPPPPTPPPPGWRGVARRGKGGAIDPPGNNYFLCWWLEAGFY